MDKEKVYGMGRLFAGAALLGAAAIAMAQTPGQPAFDAVSVKPTEANDHGRRAISPGRFELTATTLGGFIRRAYGVRVDQLTGGPSWMETDLWSVFAEADGKPNEAQMNLMLQAALADRFQLRVHRETREANVYALVAAQGQTRLAPSRTDSEPDRYLRVYSQPPNGTVLDGHRARIADLMERLQTLLHQPVIDRTGLPGEYDFKLEFSGESGPERTSSIIGAIRAQLGLKLEITKGPVELLVVDHAEKPKSDPEP